MLLVRACEGRPVQVLRYRGSGGFRLKLSDQMGFEMSFEDGSEFQMCRAATKKFQTYEVVSELKKKFINVLQPKAGLVQ